MSKRQNFRIRGSIDRPRQQWRWANDLSPNDEKLSELLVKIKALKADPKSANISGTWVCNEDGNALEMTLKDTGADAVAWNLSEAGGGRQTTGSFTRTGAALEGTRPLEMRGVPGELTVEGTN